jgi:FtsP/CotA-like multicopper oxidase with cupredoxin domain
MNMVPGNKYVLRYKNLLPYEPKSADMNVLKDPNVSNLHTHGLHISGESPGDDVTRFFEGKRGGDFVYDIPADHMGGTFWYHAHHHGSTFLQVSTGGFGLIVIDDSGDRVTDGSPISQYVTDMTEQELIIGFLDPGNRGTGGDTLVGGDLGATWTVNGVVNGDLHVPSGEWQHWRVLLADADSKPKTVSIGSQCELELMARDGVWRTTVPRAIPTNSMSLTGASRADIAVRCSGNADISVGNTVVANVVAGDPGNSLPNPYGTANGSPATWDSFRPTYLRDLRDEPVGNTETVRMGARTINGSRFDHGVPTFEMNADALQEWNLNGAKNHPFHLHIYHVQMDGNCGEFEDGEYYDVVAENCTLLFDLNADNSSVYEGRTIMHCHILEHEDQGAMGWLKVNWGQGGPEPIGAPTFPADGDIAEPYSTYYVLGDTPSPTPPAAPSNLLVTGTSSSSVDLSWADGSDNEDNFEIERAPGGSGSFNNIATVGEDVTSYSDTDVSADTAYDYQVRATNSAGESGFSNVASATTDPVTGATSVVVGSLVVATEGTGRGFKRGRADIIITDDQGTPIAGALVHGDFSGEFNESVVAESTDSGGLVTYATSGSAKGNVSVTFCIASVTNTTLPYISGEVCVSN